MRWSSKDGRGAAVSALISGGLFTLPWLVMALGVYAEVSPATDIVVEMYAPLEAVYLQIDPPPVEDPNTPLPEEPVDPSEPVDEEAPEGAADGDEAGADEADEEAGGEEGGPDDAPEGAVDGEGPPDGEGGEGDGEAGDGEAAGTGDGDGDATKVKKKGRPSKCNNPHPNVREGADGVMEVDRSLVDYYTHSLNRFMELGYSEPYEREGMKGFLIGGFGCTSPVHKAGLRRGDVLMTVNGKKTRTWVGVYLLYKKLSKETDFEIVVLRRGATTPTTLRFRVVES
jgi:hypothetical protein